MTVIAAPLRPLVEGVGASRLIMKPAVAAGIILSDLWSGGADPWLTPFLMACVVAWDSTRLACTRNVVIGYHVLVLGMGPYLVSGVDRNMVHEFAFWVTLSFLAGLALGGLMLGGVRPFAERSITRHCRSKSPTTLLWVPLALHAAVVVLDVALIGPQAYFSAGTQVAGIRTYAQGGLGAQQIVKLALDSATIGFVSAYAALVFGKDALNWRLLTLLLVVMPLLRLERGAVVINLLALLLLYQLVASPQRRRAVPVGLLVVLPILMAGAGLGLGVIREASLSSTGRADSSVVAVGEFSPVIVVDEALDENPGYGSEALWGAMTTRFLPRQWFPEKIANSTERFMRSHDRAALAAGFSLAPTALGALLLTYGKITTAFFALFVGLVLRAPRRNGVQSGWMVGLTSLVYFSLYSLMRNDPVNSFTQLLLTAAFFVVAHNALRGRRGAR